jgi:hypothetical protein
VCLLFGVVVCVCCRFALLWLSRSSRALGRSPSLTGGATAKHARNAHGTAQHFAQSEQAEEGTHTQTTTDEGGHGIVRVCVFWCPSDLPLGGKRPSLWCVVLFGVCASDLMHDHARAVFQRSARIQRPMRSTQRVCRGGEGRRADAASQLVMEKKMRLRSGIDQRMEIQSALRASVTALERPPVAPFAGAV